MKRLSVLAAALLAASCAIGPRGQIATFDVPADQAAFLTVIRPSTLGFCCTIPLFVDGRKVLGLWVREHATITIPAGERTIAIQKGYSFNTLTIQAKPGGHYYVVMDQSFFETDPRLWPDEAAQELMQSTTKLDIK